MIVSTTGTKYSYYSAPRFYITDLGKSASVGQPEVYKIDAAGWGGSADAVAVVEATFDVYTGSWDPSK
jgi:Tfp pilus assembly protein PilX